MSADNSTAPVVYRELARFVGYRFGDDGSVWSRWIRDRLGDEWKPLKGRQPSDDEPYRTVSLKNQETGRSETRRIHCLIAEAFLGAAPDGMEVRHKNGIKVDCRADNLEYGTRFANMHDKFRHGTQQRGEDCYNATLTWAMVRIVRRAKRRGVSNKAIAARLGITAHRVARVARYEIWKPIHLSAGKAFMPLKPSRESA